MVIPQFLRRDHYFISCLTLLLKLFYRALVQNIQLPSLPIYTHSGTLCEKSHEKGSPGFIIGRERASCVPGVWQRIPLPGHVEGARAQPHRRAALPVYSFPLWPPLLTHSSPAAPSFDTQWQKSSSNPCW